MTRKTLFSLLLLPFLGAWLCGAAAFAEPPTSRHPHRPPPPQHRPPVRIEIEGPRIGDDEDDDTAAVQADGRIVVVPAAPGDWERSLDVAAGTFALYAPLTLPASLPKEDVAAIRAVFNDAVRKASVGARLDDDRSRLSITGGLAPGAGFGRVELLHILLERADGKIFVQDLSIGL